MKQIPIKYWNFLFIAFSVLFNYGCIKNDNKKELPSSFTKKVLIEEFSGEWCASCVVGTKQFLEILENSPTKTIGVSIHSGDPFEIEFPAIAPFLINNFNIQYFPFALVDRTVDESLDLDVLVDQRFRIKYNAGLNIKTKIEGHNLDITVQCSAGVDFDNVLLSVYLIEDNVPESSPGAQAAGGGNYIHQKLLREVLSSKIGDPIQLKKELISEKNYSLNISKYKEKDLTIIAILHFGSMKNYEVINANSSKAGENSGW